MTLQREGQLRKAFIMCLGGIVAIPYLSVALQPAKDQAAQTSHVGAVVDQSAVDVLKRLYIVDSADGGLTSQVLAFGTESKQIVRTFPAAHMPDAAISPDGLRLYVQSMKWNAAGQLWNASLSTYDTVSGTLLGNVASSDEVERTVPQYPTRMAVSRSGRFLYLLKNHQVNLIDDYYLSVFDTSTSNFLPYRASLPRCATAVIFPTTQDLLVDVVCQTGVHNISFGAGGVGNASVEVFPLTSINPRDAQLGAAFFLPGRNRIAMVTHDLKQALFDRRTRVLREIEGGRREDRWVGLQSGLVTASKLYFGSGPEAARRAGSPYFDQITEADPDTLVEGSTLKLSTHYYSLCLSADGQTIYAVSPGDVSVTAVDATQLKESEKFRGLGKSPIFAVVPRR